MPINQLTDTDLNASDESDENGEADAPRRTNSVTGTAIVQALVGNAQQTKVVQLPGVYMSQCKGEYAYDDVMLSGKVIMPADGHFRRYILVSHYTLGANYECPSNSFSLEGVLAQLGYCMIIPDYMGYGVTADRLHPYLVMDISAINVMDMYYAVKSFMEARDIRPEYDDIYLMGYSQGGATTMAVEMMFENGYAESMYGYAPKLRRVFAGGGPYDVKSTYDRFVETNLAGYPVAVPLVVQGMTAAYPKLGMKNEDFMQPRIITILNEKVNAKVMSTSELNEVIGTTVTSEILTPTGMNRASSEVCQLYKCMDENSVISMDWTPQAPIYMFHSIDDETVPYENATRASARWDQANIKFNFGHYGTHVKGCLRFIYSVRTLLEEDQKEEDSL